MSGTLAPAKLRRRGYCAENDDVTADSGCGVQWSVESSFERQSQANCGPNLLDLSMLCCTKATGTQRTCVLPESELFLLSHCRPFPYPVSGPTKPLRLRFQRSFVERLLQHHCLLDIAIVCPAFEPRGS